MVCVACVRGFHDECGDKCCCEMESDSSESSGRVEPDARSGTEKTRVRRDDVSISAGRKRAARDYAIDPAEPCEWRGRSNVGGGFLPVVGCLVGFQEARHHGPDKNTTNNARENIHLICTACHNLWHRRNDPLYGADKCPEGIQQHNPRWATIEELMAREPAA